MPLPNPKPGNESRCARCDAPFICGMKSAEPCWCASLPPLEPEPGRGCLCRACLEQALKERTA
jgi:ribosomal protein L34E